MVVDFDDFSRENNRLDLLCGLKDIIPNFKCTLFTVLGGLGNRKFSRGSGLTFLEMVSSLDWIELAVHGAFHKYKECEKWDAGMIEACVSKYEETGCFKKIFKAPYWAGNDDIYDVLDSRGYIIAENKPEVAKKHKKVYILGPDSVHGHIQNTCGNGLEEKFDYYASLKGDFKFISEVVK